MSNLDLYCFMFAAWLTMALFRCAGALVDQAAKQKSAGELFAVLLVGGAAGALTSVLVAALTAGANLGVYLAVRACFAGAGITE